MSSRYNGVMLLKALSCQEARQLLHSCNIISCEDDNLGYSFKTLRLEDGRVLQVTLSGTHAHRTDGTFCSIIDERGIGKLLHTSFFQSSGIPVNISGKQEILEAGIYYSVLFASEEVYSKWTDSIFLESIFFDSFGYSLPQQELFLDEIVVLSNSLCEKLEIPKAELDHSLASINAVDEVVRQRGGKRCTEPDIFPSLIAYVCLTLSQNLDASLKMVQDAAGDWMPIIDKYGDKDILWLAADILGMLHYYMDTAILSEQIFQRIRSYISTDVYFEIGKLDPCTKTEWLLYLERCNI